MPLRPEPLHASSGASGDAEDTIRILVDGEPVRARVGQTVAAALLSAGERVLRRTRASGDARGVYCAMGVCYECVVKVDGVIERACMREVRDGMRIERLQRFERSGKR